MEASTIQLQAMNMNHSLNELMVCTKPPQQPQQQQLQQQQQEKKMKPHPESSLRCPRCDSTNTKFCYYNNYSLSQPRYFCKGCRRYWTQGGSLRNVPVGGGCRKNKRSSSSKSRQLDHHHLHLHSSNSLLISPLTLPSLPYNLNDLTLYEHGNIHTGNPNSNVLGASPALFDILRGGFSDTIQGGLCHIYNGGVEEKSMAAQVGGGVGATAAAAPVGEEYCKSMDGEGKMVVGMQWQMAGDHGNMGVDPGRDYSWGTAGVAPSWHGLVNSSLL